MCNADVGEPPGARMQGSELQSVITKISRVNVVYGNVVERSRCILARIVNEDAGLGVRCVAEEYQVLQYKILFVPAFKPTPCPRVYGSPSQAVRANGYRA